MAEAEEAEAAVEVAELVEADPEDLLEEGTITQAAGSREACAKP